MLEYLHIRDLALIDDMELEFSSGINVLTGETGAGKSFILKALAFVTGEKIASDIVRPGSQKATVEAIFTAGNKELVFKRELNAESGRSRFYLNGSLSSQDALKNLRPQLISHTSQHAQQTLLSPIFQAQLLDSGIQAPELLGRRQTLLEKLKVINEEIKEIQNASASIADKRELLEMQAAEIARVNPQPGEEQKLEELRAQIRAETGLRQNYARFLTLLHGEENHGLLHGLTELERIVRQLAVNDEQLSRETEIIGEFRQHLNQLANNLPKPHSPSPKQNLDAIEARLFAFAQLKRKLRRDFTQIINLKEEIKNSLSLLDASALDISRKNREKDKIIKELHEVIDAIKPLRHEAAQSFASKLANELKELGFSEQIAILPEFFNSEIWPGITDERGRIFWAPNPGQRPQPLDQIASGGELSRFLLALNTLDPRNDDLTYIFDEVDAGIGGLTLNKVGDKLCNLARTRQVILITHWPQLAARADNHFLITKTVKNGQTFTQCEHLDAKAKKIELERMAGRDILA